MDSSEMFLKTRIRKSVLKVLIIYGIKGVGTWTSRAQHKHEVRIIKTLLLLSIVAAHATQLHHCFGHLLAVILADRLLCLGDLGKIRNRKNPNSQRIKVFSRLVLILKARAKNRIKHKKVTIFNGI